MLKSGVIAGNRKTDLEGFFCLFTSTSDPALPFRSGGPRVICETCPAFLEDSLAPALPLYLSFSFFLFY